MPGTEGVEITGPAGDRYDEILTPEALGLIAALHRELGARRAELLAAVLGLLLIVVLLAYRRWAESVYIALSWFALASNGIYLSFPRSTLLWFPAIVLLARAAARRPWVAQAWLTVTAPLAFVLGAAWAASGWVN